MVITFHGYNTVSNIILGYSFSNSRQNCIFRVFRYLVSFVSHMERILVRLLMIEFANLLNHATLKSYSALNSVLFL